MKSLLTQHFDRNVNVFQVFGFTPALYIFGLTANMCFNVVRSIQMSKFPFN